MGTESWLDAPRLRLRQGLATWVEAKLGGDAGGGDQARGDGDTSGGGDHSGGSNAAGRGDQAGCGNDAPGDGDEAAMAVFRTLARRGLFRYVAPRGFGGARRAVEARDLCVIREALASVSPLADTLFAVQALAAWPVAAAGTPAQQAAYLPRLAAGADVGAFALTEPDAGSDAASVQLRARRRGTGYVLDGVKSLISNAGLAQLYVVFGSTHPVRKGNGLSAFVVEADSPGVTVTERVALISPHPIGTVAFQSCRVPRQPAPRGTRPRSGDRLGDTECAPLQRRRRRRGHGRPGAGGGGTPRQRAASVRPPADALPGHPLQDCRHGHRPGGRAPAGIPGRPRP